MHIGDNFRQPSPCSKVSYCSPKVRDCGKLRPQVKVTFPIYTRQYLVGQFPLPNRREKCRRRAQPRHSVYNLNPERFPPVSTLRNSSSQKSLLALYWNTHHVLAKKARATWVAQVEKCQYSHYRDYSGLQVFTALLKKGLFWTEFWHMREGVG